MKKFLLSLVCLAFAVTAAAQKQHVFGIRAGLNVSSLSKSGLDSRASFQAGFSYQIKLIKRPLYLETGLYLTDKGGKLKEDGNVLKSKVLYLQLPVVVNYHINITSLISIQPFAGIYYAYGLDGKSKTKIDGERHKLNLFTDDPQQFKRSDVGVRVGAGVNFLKHYYAGLGYDQGLNNIVKEEGKSRTGNFFITVGYTF